MKVKARDLDKIFEGGAGLCLTHLNRVSRLVTSKCTWVSGDGHG